MFIYQVRLADHDSVGAPQHKLLPSVIGDMKVVRSRDLTVGALSYSGATCIGIRTSKHLGSSAFANVQDLKRVCSLAEIRSSYQNDQIEEEVMIVTVDYENPDE